MTSNATAKLQQPAERGTRWGQGIRVDSDYAEEKLIAAARSCYKKLGVTNTKVEDVARQAKVSRSTVYRYFKNRDEILTGVVIHDALQISRMMMEQLGHIDCFGEFITEAILLSLREAPKSPAYQLLIAAETKTINRLCISSQEFAAMITDLLIRNYERAQANGELRDGIQLPHLVEWLARVLMSYLTTPSPLLQNEEDIRALLETFLLPAIIKPANEIQTTQSTDI